MHRDGRLIWADSLRLANAIAAARESPSQLNGASALATLICAVPDPDAARDCARAVLAPFEPAGVLGGATVVAGLTVCRILAVDGDALRPAVRRLVAELRAIILDRQVDLPRVWEC